MHLEAGTDGLFGESFVHWSKLRVSSVCRLSRDNEPITVASRTAFQRSDTILRGPGPRRRPLRVCPRIGPCREALPSVGLEGPAVAAGAVTAQDGGEWLSTGVLKFELRVRGLIDPVKNSGKSQTPTITRLLSQPNKL